MKTSKKEIINEIIETEGGHTNDPSDSGGETKFGITEKVARKHGYYGKMANLPHSLAFDIYSIKYWDAVLGDDIAKVSVKVAAEVVDTGVNMGTSSASKMLQRSINCFVRQDLKIDGKIGARSIKSLRMAVDKRGEDVILKALNCLQGAKYIRLCERRKKDKKFIFGWLKNRVVIPS